MAAGGGLQVAPVQAIPSGAGTGRYELRATWDGSGVAPSVNTGTQVPVMRRALISEAMLVALDSAGDRVSDSCTVTVSKVSSGGVETALGTIALAAASINYDQTLSGWEYRLLNGDTVKFELTSAPSTAVRLVCTLRTQEV